ncbi:DNA polymerase V-like [Teratosphaeria destructans]|uniref:DNA polymerase V-like n=1 Tax=Teratosphaeria destructans TaxID=418781 RepID=A0A9W7T1J9_9PEZI|nr:DNA polymerase V-like [Teratosphaeria destructans]
MPGWKRPLQESDAQALDHVHPSRKRRVEYGGTEKQLAQCYHDLADEVATVRLQATKNLIRILSEQSEQQIGVLEGALTRLIRGLCSGRKAARPGFSIALSEALRIAFELAYSGKATQLGLDGLIDKVEGLTQPEGKASGQEKRDHLLGRRFAFQAILQSDIAKSKNLPDTSWRHLLDAVCNLASQKDWLRSECGAMLWQYLESEGSQGVSDGRISSLIDSLNTSGMLKTAEGIAIWLSVASKDTDLLPKGIWHKKDPLSSDERPTLKKILLGSSVSDAHEPGKGKGMKSGSRQSKPSFAWRVALSHLSRRGPKAFRQTWEDIVQGLFADSASAERKALGLQIAGVALAVSDTQVVQLVLSPKVVGYVLSLRANAKSNLHDAAKVVFDSAMLRARNDPSTSAKLVASLIRQGAFDQHTKTKTLESIIQQAGHSSLGEVVNVLLDAMTTPNTPQDKQAENWRRTLADNILRMVQSRRDASQLSEKELDPAKSLPVLAEWLRNVLRQFVSFGYGTQGEATPPFSEASRSIFRARLMSILGILLDQPQAVALQAPEYVVKQLRELDEDLHKPLSQQAREAVTSARKATKSLRKRLSSGKPSDTTQQAYLLLFDLSLIQVYSEEPDSVDVLRDLQNSYESRQTGAGDSSDMLIELLLSFVSKQSTPLRKLAEQVFAAFASELTADSLQSMLEILAQKENMSGQQELFQQVGSDEEDRDAAANGEDSDDGFVDADDMSDVEISKGDQVDGDDSDDDDDQDESESGSSSDSDRHDEAGDEDEEAVFDRKLADALGTAGMDVDSDDDGSDMDDDQMMALEPHLNTIFKERKKAASKKQDNKDAKANIINFKNRVLDLVNIYVKSQSSNLLAMDIILPLTTLVRTTSSKPTAEKAFAVLKQYFDACSKHKSYPRPEDVEACFEVLAAVHEEMKAGGSKLHASACSRSSLFLTRVVVSRDIGNFPRVGQMYGELHSSWFMDRTSKIHKSVFTEWMSWSLNAKKLE